MRSRLSLARQIIFWIFALAMAGGVYIFTRDFTTCWRLTSLPGIPPSSCTGESVKPLEEPVISTGKTPVPSTATAEVPVPEEVEYPTWDGGSRINILFVGLRGGDPTEPDCPFCTDTLILLAVDPITKQAGMLSIPRDMWVNIPGFGYSRINTAWSLGRGSKLPGGGPRQAMKTVSHFIGVPVDYFVQVDFDTFVDSLVAVEIKGPDASRVEIENLFLQGLEHRNWLECNKMSVKLLFDGVRGRRINTRKRVRLLLAFFEEQVPMLFQDLRAEAMRKDRHLSIDFGRLVEMETGGLEVVPFSDYLSIR